MSTAIAGVQFRYNYALWFECLPLCSYAFASAPPSGMTIANGIIDWLPAVAGLSCVDVLTQNEHGGNRSTLCVDVAPLGTDTQAPSRSTITSVTGITRTSFRVHYTAASDNVGVVRYRLRCQKVGHAQPTKLCGTSSTLSISASGLTPNTSYKLWVQAVDAAGNATNTSGQTPRTVRTLP